MSSQGALEGRQESPDRAGDREVDAGVRSEQSGRSCPAEFAGGKQGHKPRSAGGLQQLEKAGSWFSPGAPEGQQFRQHLDCSPAGLDLDSRPPDPKATHAFMSF